MKYSAAFIVFFTVLFFCNSTYSQEYNQTVSDEKSGNPIIVGAADVQGLKTIGTWYEEEYALYTPDQTVLDSIQLFKDQLPDVFIVLGTWCGDSKEHVPHFYKIANMLNYPEDKIFMVAVDRDKKGGDFCLADFNITLVPTFIFTYKGEEIGRIIETPVKTLEQDMLGVLRKLAPTGF